VNEMGSTTTTAKAPSGPRRSNSSYDDLFDRGGDTEKSKESPLGDTLLPLLFMSLAFGMFVYFRRKRSEA